MTSRRSFLATLATLITAPVVAMGLARKKKPQGYAIGGSLAVNKIGEITPPFLDPEAKDWTLYEWAESTDFRPYRNLKGSMHDALRNF